MSVEALVALGAKRLVEVLHETVGDDPHQRQRLEDVLRQGSSANARPVGVLLGSIERRLAVLEEADGYHDWCGAASVGADIDSLRQEIVEGILPLDAQVAANRLEQLVNLANFLFETSDDSGGEISGALFGLSVCPTAASAALFR